MDDIDTCDEYDMTNIQSSSNVECKYVDDVDSLLNCIKIWQKEKVDNAVKVDVGDNLEVKLDNKRFDGFLTGENNINECSLIHQLKRIPTIDGDNIDSNVVEGLNDESEDNPISSLGSVGSSPDSIKSSLITESDIIRYGKTDSMVDVKLDDTNDTPPNLLKDVTVNCQIDQIISNEDPVKKEVEGENEVVKENEKIRGVCFCRSDNSWTAWWTDKGRSRKKAFKLSLYGYDEAKRMAIEYRRQIENMIPELREKRPKVHRKKIEKTLNIKNPINNIYSTRSKSMSHLHHNKPMESRGIYYKDDTWYSTWIDSTGRRQIKQFPINREQTFLSARNLALGTVKNSIEEENIKRRKLMQGNEGYFNTLEGHKLNTSNTNQILLKEINLDRNVINGIEKAINSNDDTTCNNDVNLTDTKVNAFCLSQVTFGNKSSLHILPTLVKGPGNSNILTVVVVNTNQHL